MGKDLSITILLDFYGDLLTEKQSRALDLYYNEDLSLAEIAEPLGISRQGARDFIKRGEKQLYEFENALGLVRRFNDVKNEIFEISKMFSETKDYIDSYIHSERLSSAVNEIEKRLLSISDML